MQSVQRAAAVAVLFLVGLSACTPPRSPPSRPGESRRLTEFRKRTAEMLMGLQIGFEEYFEEQESELSYKDWLGFGYEHMRWRPERCGLTADQVVTELHAAFRRRPQPFDLYSAPDGVPPNPENQVIDDLNLCTFIGRTINCDEYRGKVFGEARLETTACAVEDIVRLCVNIDGDFDGCKTTVIPYAARHLVFPKNPKRNRKFKADSADRGNLAAEIDKVLRDFAGSQ